MDISLFIAISLFAFIMSVTPGPNNVMLLASGAQFGYRKTLPHIFGIIVGIAFLLSAILLGLGYVFERFPWLNDILKVIGSAYLFWLAWKIATASTQLETKDTLDIDATAKPQTFFQAAIFQFVNPKAWAMAVGSISTFTLTGNQYFISGLWIMLCFALMGFIAISLWTYLGVAIAQILTTQKHKKRFNYIMAGMTVATLFFILK